MLARILKEWPLGNESEELFFGMLGFGGIRHPSRDIHWVVSFQVLEHKAKVEIEYGSLKVFCRQ